MPYPVPPFQYQTHDYYFSNRLRPLYHYDEDDLTDMEGRRLVSECIKYQKIWYDPIKKTDFVPENGSEVFVKAIPVDATDVELLKFFSKAGNIFQLRLMMAENGVENRGFCYVSYMASDEAKRAMNELNFTAFRKNVYLSIENSLNNCRIFVGGIPTYKTKDQVWQELSKNGVKNIVDVIMYRSYSNRAENRGFIFVEFKTHEQAASFRAKHSDCLRLWGNPVIIDWSIPIPEVDPTVLDQVKIIYLRNLNVTEPPHQLQTLLLQFVEKMYLEKVYKFKNYAFIHLTTRQEAEKLMVILKEYYANTEVEVEWAKPPSKYTTPEFRQQKVSGLSRSSSSRRTSSSSSNFSQKSDDSDSPRENTSKYQKDLQQPTTSKEEWRFQSGEKLDSEENKTNTASAFLDSPSSYGIAGRNICEPSCQQFRPQPCYPFSPSPSPHFNPAPCRSFCGHLQLYRHDYAPFSNYCSGLPCTRYPQIVWRNFHPGFENVSSLAAAPRQTFDPIRAYQRRMTELYGEECDEGLLGGLDL